MGHRAAAEALIKEFKHQLGDNFNYSLIDLLKESNVFFLKDFPVLYGKIVQGRYLLRLFNQFFNVTRFRIGFYLTTLFFRTIVLFSKHRFRDIFRMEKPDIVVNVNAYTNVVIQWTKVRELFDFKFCNVITDLTNINYAWAFGNYDLCVAPNEMAYDDLNKYHTPKREVLGYPLDRKFLNIQSVYTNGDGRLKILIFARNIQSILSLVGAVQKIKDSLNITVICGTNYDVKELLEQRFDFIHILGYVGNVQDYMTETDVVVSKAGPGVIMEAIYLNKPLILTHYLGNQEKRNVDFVEKNNFGYYCPTAESFLETVGKIKESRPVPTNKGFHDQYNTGKIVSRILSLLQE